MAAAAATAIDASPRGELPRRPRINFELPELERSDAAAPADAATPAEESDGEDDDNNESA